MNTAGSDVDSVHGQPEGTSALPLRSPRAALFRREEIRAYEVGVPLEGLYVDGAVHGGGGCRGPAYVRPLGRNRSVAAPGGKQCVHQCEQ
ncbi:hypothetical protein ACFZDJ_36380 [Streptomyces sp. NPDC007896]|uniref:hypothetical protein n=1 Tax=Streptomyces sp. NPDC007896 TaxID=3364784 RepID=UPI0036EE4F4D